MKILWLVLAFLGTAPLTAMPLISVNFMSIGMGIDADAYETVKGMMEVEEAHGHVLSVEERIWGLEGELVLCGEVSDDQHRERIKSLLNIVIGENALVDVKIQRACMIPMEVPLACTRDINPWGHPSLCRCSANSGLVYHPQQGRCVSGELSGVIQLAIAVGGETGGFHLVSYDGQTRTELVIPPRLKEQALRFAQKGFPVCVSGAYKIMQTVERGTWLAFEIDELLVEE